MISKTLLILICILNCNILFAETTERLDSLLLLLEQEGLSTLEKGEICNKTAHYYSDNLQDKTTAIQYYNQALSHSRIAGNDDLTADIINNLGVCYEIIGNHDSSIYCFEKYLDLTIQLKDSTGIGDAYNNLVLVHEFNGQYEKAIEYYIESAKIKRPAY